MVSTNLEIFSVGVLQPDITRRPGHTRTYHPGLPNIPSGSSQYRALPEGFAARSALIK